MHYFRSEKYLVVRKSSLGEDSLCHDTREGEHSKSAVNNFLKLHGLNFLLRLALEESSIKAKVSGSTSGSFQHLNNCYGVKDLEQTEPKKHLRHASLLNGSIVGSDGGKGIESLRGGVHTEAKINGNESKPCHHANTSVLELGFTKEIDGGKVRESEGVESDITHTSIKVWWGLKEGKSLRFLGQRSDGTGYENKNWTRRERENKMKGDNNKTKFHDRRKNMVSIDIDRKCRYINLFGLQRVKSS